MPHVPVPGKESRMPNNTELEELLDKQRISEVVGPRYARAMDYLDGEALKACFHKDGWIEATFLQKIGLEGLDYVTDGDWVKASAHDWIDVVVGLQATSIHRFHYVFNTGIRINGNFADVESNAFAGDRRKDDDGALNDSFYGSRYIDKLEKRGGEWKILVRRTPLEWLQSFPTLGGPDSPLQVFTLISGLSPSHPLYCRL